MALSKSYIEMTNLRESKGEKVIPKGPYCSGCPYLDLDDEKPYQYNGYCWFLERGDWEIEATMELVSSETGEKVMGDELPFPVSLLWDECKECGVKEQRDEDLEHET